MAKAKEDAEAESNNKAYSSSAEDDYSWGCRGHRWSKSSTSLLNSKRYVEY